uniref:Ig-like domain-containing protein n=1 Tax=Aquila chrysaetos chrysaetos TaxID=223781 RepID=A0A663F3U4_AQUCH
ESQAHAPVVYPLIQCTDCGDTVSFGCLVTDYFPQPVTVTWISNVKGDNETFPVIQSSNSYYSLSTQLTVPASSLEGNNFQCRVDHSILPTQRRSLPPPPPPPQPQPGCKPKVEVTILPPSLEDLYLSQNASITCVATNLKSYEDVKFSWSRDQGSALDVTSGAAEKLENGLYRLTSTLKICADEWNSGEKFTCTVNIPEIQEPISQSTGNVSVKAPSVYVFPPPAEELARQETATLTCLALGFRPRDILVTWTQEDRPVSPGSFSIFGPQKEGDTYTVYSKLSVPAADWQRGDSFACVVGHDGIPLHFVQKTMDKAIGKPTSVNVSVVLADADVTCY